MFDIQKIAICCYPWTLFKILFYLSINNKNYLKSIYLFKLQTLIELYLMISNRQRGYNE